MKRTPVVLGAVIVSSLFWLVGCGQGTYRIPAVEPVVKPKPENDLLEDIEGGDQKAAPTSESKPSTPTPPADKAPEAKPEAKPEESKPDTAKPSDAKPDTDAKPAAKAAAKPVKSGKPAKK